MQTTEALPEPSSTHGTCAVVVAWVLVRRRGDEDGVSGRELVKRVYAHVRMLANIRMGVCL